MNILCIRHVTFEGAGVIADWALHSGHSFRELKPFEGEAFPGSAEIDALVLMGGPMSASDTDCFPWLSVEKLLIRKVLNEGKPVLGICLGAQLLAEAHGASVFSNTHKEIGWFPVTLTEAGTDHRRTAHLPGEFTTFHWHGDTFDLPDSVVHLAGSEACTHQAFAVGRSLGLQFHMEMTEEGIEELSDRCSDELIGHKQEPWIQSPKELTGHKAMAFNHKALKELLDCWIAG